jgi:hypothetical protein
MNKKLKVVLTRHRYSEQGFAMPIALGLGFVMLLIGATMIMRSQGDQVTASAQKVTAQSLAVNEGGIARSLSKLNQFYPHLLRLNYDPINTATSKIYLGPDGIPNSGDEGTTAVDQWSSPPNPPPCTPTGSLPSGLISGSVGSGSYQIRAYRYRDPDGIPNTGDEIGNLLIEGQQGSAVSQLQVSMPITRSTVASAGSFPGLYASNRINLGNNDVLKVIGGNGSAANVICRDCPVPSNQCVNGAPTPAGLNSAVGRGPKSGIDGNIIIGDPDPPPVPTAPATACSATTLASGTPCSITLPTNELTPNNAEGILPRSSELATHKPGTPYHYIVSSINFGGGNGKLTVYTATNPQPLSSGATAGANSISVTSANGYANGNKLKVGSDPEIYTISSISGNTLTITPNLGTNQAQSSVVRKTDPTYNPHGDPVYLYVSGNISFSGSASIVHAGTPDLLRIYGNPADPTNSTTDQVFTLNGGASTSNIFVYAPDAVMGIEGGSSDPDIQGAIWVKTWNGSSSNRAEIRVPDNMPSLLGGSFSGVSVQPLRSGSPKTWQRQPVTQ